MKVIQLAVKMLVELSKSHDVSAGDMTTIIVMIAVINSCHVYMHESRKHLKKYVEWYTSRGFHVITFTFPNSEVLHYQIGEKGEDDVGFLVNHLAGWLDKEHEKNLKDLSLMGQIKGCIVDSAPIVAPDPQVLIVGQLF
ncbi:hypothetical protein ACFE04_027126 [Oxalis oulophora]